MPRREFRGIRKWPRTCRHVFRGLVTHAKLIPPPDPLPRSARALPGAPVVSSPGVCPGCGKALTGRQKCCSGKCRAALSRQRRIAVPVEELRVLRSLVKTTLETLWEAKAKLDKYV